MKTYIATPYGVFDVTPNFWTPDFGQPVHMAMDYGIDHGESIAPSGVIDIPSSEITDLSDTI